MSRPTELRRGRRLSAAPSKQAEMRTSWMSQKGNTVSPQRLALEKAYQTDKDDLLNMTMTTMKEDPMIKFVERRFDTEEIISAIERNQANIHGDGISVDLSELINEKPTAILGSIGRELKKDSIKRKMESDMKAFTVSRHHSLVENIKKKADASKYRDSNHEVVITNLVNDDKRDRLLDVGLMKEKEMHMDYLYKKETRLLEEGLNGTKKKSRREASKTQNQNEELIVSKHIRKNPFSLQLDIGISNKLYYMNVEKKKKKMAFIRMAMEVYKQKNSLVDRRKTNSEVIEYLLGFQKAENNIKHSKEFSCLAMLRRIYVRHSHRDIVENQNRMNRQEFKEIFKKLKLYPDYIALAKIDEIFLETTQAGGKQSIDNLEFIECMRRAAQVIYEAIEESDAESSDSQAEDQLLFKLYDRFIHKEMSQYLTSPPMPKIYRFNLPHHEKLSKPTVQQYLLKQDPIIKFLFTSFTKSTDDDVRPFEDPKEPMISFEQIFEMFTLTGLFPHLCEKMQIRFYFDYVAPTELGLDYEDFKVFLPLIGMDIIDHANKISLHEHLKLKLEPSELKLPKEPLEMLKTFFKSSKYIGSLRVLKQKIIMNENKHRVMEISAKKTFYNMAKFNKTLLNYMDS